MGFSLLKKIFLVAVINLLAIGLLTNIPFAGQKVELTLWSWRTEDVPAYEKFLQAFSAKNPNIAVKFMPFKNVEYNTILTTALQSGTGPDIVQLRSYGGMQQYAASELLVPLDDKVPGLKDFPSYVLDGARFRGDGRVYGVPFAIQTIQIFYNKKIFAQHGLSLPKTWADLLKLCEALKGKGVVPIAAGAKDGWTLEIMHGVVCPNFYGGNDFYNKVVKGETTFQDSRYINALARMLELKPYFPDGFLGIGYTDTQMMFIQEMAAIFIGGSFEIGYFTRMNPNLDLGVFPSPPLREGDPAIISTWVDGSFGIYSKTKHLEEAIKFVNFLATKEFGQMFTDELKQISPIPGVVPTHSVLKECLRLAKNSTPYIMLTGFRWGSPTGSVLIQNGLQGMFAGKIGSEEVTRQIQEGVAKWYEPFQKR